MTPNFLTLFTRPDRAWEGIRRSEEADDRHYIKHLLLLALIPPVSLFIGTTFVGWSLVEDERVRLTAGSAFQLALLLYFTIIVGVVIMGAFVKWMARTFEATPTLNQCIGFISYTITPFYLLGLSALYPNRWFGAIVLMIAALYSTYLLFVGMPTFMRERNAQSMLYAISTWGVGLLVLVTILVTMILFWQFALRPDYERDDLRDQTYPTVDERPQSVPGTR